MTLTHIFQNYPLEFKSPIRIVDFGRNDLPKLLKTLEFNKGAEIGVWKGDYSETLITRHPNLELYLIDSWQAYPGGTKVKIMGQIVDADDEVFNEAFRFTAKRFKEYSNVCLLPKSSKEAVKDFKDTSLDFVYIDADHRLEMVINDIVLWSPKVKPGGIIAGHDYNKMTARPNICQVKEAVDAYTSAYDIRPWFVFGKPEDIHDSWMWVNGS